MEVKCEDGAAEIYRFRIGFQTPRAGPIKASTLNLSSNYNLCGHPGMLDGRVSYWEILQTSIIASTSHATSTAAGVWGNIPPFIQLYLQGIISRRR
jgi:hypothetical protein